MPSAFETRTIQCVVYRRLYTAINLRPPGYWLAGHD
jgi:hypothetical protein